MYVVYCRNNKTGIEFEKTFTSLPKMKRFVSLCKHGKAITVLGTSKRVV